MFPFQFDDFTSNNSNYTPDQLRYQNLMQDMDRFIRVDNSSRESLAQPSYLDSFIPFDQSEVQGSNTNQQFKEFGCYSSDSQTITIKTQNGNQMEWPIFFGEYESQECLGSGGFSSVVHVINTKSKLDHAAKVFPYQITNDPEKSKYILNEIKFLKKIDHPYVIKYINSFSVINKYGEKYFVIIMKYCKNGNLTNYVLNHEVDDTQLKSIINKICIAFDYLHNSCGIAHGDTKTDNILLDDNLNPIISDFGFASDRKISYEKIKKFTLEFAAPEVLRAENYNRFMADIWSLGITLYGLKTTKLPFKAHIPFIDQILSGELLINRDDVLENLVWKCTQMDPEDRPTIKEILGDIYFSTK